MKISELIAELEQAEKTHGDIEVLVDACGGIYEVEEVGVDVDDTGFMIWPGVLKEDQ